MGLRHCLLRDYNTAIPLATYQAVAYTGILMAMLSGFIVLAATAAVITSLCPGTEAWNPAGRGRDAVLAVSSPDRPRVDRRCSRCRNFIGPVLPGRRTRQEAIATA